MTESEKEQIEKEAEIVTIENDILPELREQLNALTSPDYDPAKNADNEYRERDIGFLEDEIVEALKRLRTLKQLSGKLMPEYDGMEQIKNPFALQKQNLIGSERPESITPGE